MIKSMAAARPIEQSIPGKYDVNKDGSRINDRDLVMRVFRFDRVPGFLIAMVK